MAPPACNAYVEMSEGLMPKLCGKLTESGMSLATPCCLKCTTQLAIAQTRHASRCPLPLCLMASPLTSFLHGKCECCKINREEGIQCDAGGYKGVVPLSALAEEELKCNGEEVADSIIAYGGAPQLLDDV
eukprot:15343651-Ditylum_brightwellii.AAC.1